MDRALGDPFLAAPSRPGNVVFDVDGCLTFGGGAIPGAKEALQAVEAARSRIVIATNNSTRTPSQLAELLSSVLDHPIAPEAIATAAMAAAEMPSPGDGPVLIVGEEGIESALRWRGFELGGPEDARSVIVGLDRSFDYDAMTAATTAVGNGARLIACNEDPSFPSAGIDVPGTGALLASIETATGKTAAVAGKPHGPMIALVRRLLGDGEVWMVGDRPETDVRFANRGGWTSILVRTGIEAPELLEGDLAPRVVIDSVADLPALLGQ